MRAPQLTILASATLTILALSSSAAGAQTVAGCYVPPVGALYVIKQAGLPQACLSTTHIEVALVGPASGWSLTGNSGIGATNFIGTTDNQPIRLVTNNLEVMRIRSAPFTPATNVIPIIGIGKTLNPGVPFSIDWDEAAFQVTPHLPAFQGTTLVGQWFGKVGGPQERYRNIQQQGFMDVGMNATGDYVIEDSDRPRLVIQRGTNGGSTLINDDPGSPLTAAANNEFAVRATGGVRLRTSADLTTGCNLAASSGTWTCTSSRSAKVDFRSIDPDHVLAKIASLPIQSWRYRGAGAGTRHIGPFAEDFYKAFGVGLGPTTISSVDADGITLAGIKALEAKTRKLEKENAELKSRLEALEVLVKRK
jgi:hypothetical protein